MKLLRSNIFEVQQITPGTYSYFEMNHNVFLWELKEENNTYHHVAFSNGKQLITLSKEEFYKYIYKNIQKYLINAVEKGVVIERPIRLLSGGLDRV